jgi:hypothetical protein
MVAHSCDASDAFCRHERRFTFGIGAYRATKMNDATRDGDGQTGPLQVTVFAKPRQNSAPHCRISRGDSIVLGGRDNAQNILAADNADKSSLSNHGYAPDSMLIH